MDPAVFLFTTSGKRTNSERDEIGKEEGCHRFTVGISV